MPRHSKRRPLVLDRATVRGIATSLSAGELPMARRNSMRERIAERIAVAKVEAEPAPAVGWQVFGPNVWMKVLRRDSRNNKQTALLRVLPGGVVPARPHAQDEECLVLEGEVFIGEQRATRGDLHVTGSEAGQGDITTRTGAMLMVRSETPLQRKVRTA